MQKHNINIYNFFDRAIPSFIKKADLVYRSSPDQNHFIMSPASMGTPLFNDQNTDLFLMFIRSYFKFLEQTSNGHDVIKNWLSYRDIDQRVMGTEDVFLNLFKQEYIPSIPTLINKSLNIPIKLDIKFYAEDYYQHLIRLSAQKRYDRFKANVSDYEIKAYVNSIQAQDVYENRLVYVFVDYVEEKSVIIAAAHVWIQPNALNHAEISLSVESQYANKGLEENLIVGVFQDIKTYLPMIDVLYVNHNIYMMGLTYGKVINSNNKIQLIENDSRAINFNLNQNDQSYELMFRVDTSNDYQVRFVFDTPAEIVINYQYVEDVDSFYTTETLLITAEDLIDGGSSFNKEFVKTDGGTSKTKALKIVSGSPSEFATVIEQDIPCEEQVFVQNSFIHRVNIHKEKWIVDDVNHKPNDLVEIRFYKDVPLHYMDYNTVTITDSEVDLPATLLNVFENTILISGSQNLMMHYENMNILSVVFSVPYRFIKFKATILNNLTITMNHTHSKAVSVFDSKEVLEHLLTDPELIEYQVDTTGYFIENSQYDRLPNDYDIDYGFLIKHIKDLYLKKGTELSYKFLFKLLFNANTSIHYPKNNMLTASDMNFIKQHIVYFRDIFEHSFETTDQLLYLLTENYEVISFGQLLNTFKYTSTVPMEFPQVQITSLFFDDVDSLLVFIEYDAQFEPYLSDSYHNVIVKGCQPSYYNGMYQATITALPATKEMLFRIPLKLHQNKIFDIKNIPPNIKDNKKPGEILIDNRKHLPESFWGMMAMLEFNTLTDDVETFAIVEQNDFVIFPMMFEVESIIDYTMFTDENESVLPLFLLNENKEVLFEAELLEYKVHRDTDNFTPKVYQLLLKANISVDVLKDMKFVRLIHDSANTFTDRIIPCRLNAKTLSVKKESQSLKQYQYKTSDSIQVYDNYAFEHSAAVIVSINEINKNINDISFLDQIIPIRKYRTYYYDSQTVIDSSFERMAFSLSLDIVRKTVTQISYMGEDVYQLTVDTAFDVSDTSDFVLFFTMDHGTENSINLHGTTAGNTIVVHTLVDLMTFNVYDHLFIQYDECLVDEQNIQCEGWCRVYFGDQQLFDDLTRITFDEIITPYYTQYSTAFRSVDDFYESIINTPDILQLIILSEKLKYYQYFKEKPATGYIAGQESLIDIFMFKTEHFSASNITLPVAVKNPIGMHSLNAGYYLSGYHASEYVYSSHSTKLKFITESTEALSFQLLEKKEACGSVNGVTHGYYAGGKIDSAYSTSLNGVSFATDTHVNLSVRLSTARSHSQGCNNTTEGFFVGGQGNQITVEVSQLQFYSETLKESSLFLTTPRTQHTINQSEHKAYIAGGQTSQSYVNDIVTFNMLSYTMIPMINTLPNVLRSAAAVSSTTSGYIMGGETPTVERSVHKIDFTTEEVSSLGITLSTPKSNCTGVQNTAKTSSGIYRVVDMNVTEEHSVNKFDDAFFINYFYGHIFSYIILRDTKFPMIIDEYLVNRLEIDQTDPEQYLVTEQYDSIIDSKNNKLTYNSIIKTDLNTIKVNYLTYEVTNTYIEAININYLNFVVGYKSVNLLQNQYNKTTCLNKSHLQDNYYYQPYSYEIINEIPLEKYRNIVFNNLHPMGLQMFAQTVFSSGQIEPLTHEVVSDVVSVPAITPTIWPTKTPTPTPSTTVTMSRTATKTPTPTTTSTTSRSPTPTQTPSHTGTGTPTPSTTKTQSPTPSSTVTLSSTNTRTPTPTPTKTLTSSPTRTLTASPTMTGTPTTTPTLTSSPTNTRTPTPTKTLSASPTKTLSASPTKTLSASPTMTLTATPTSTITMTPTPTISITPSRSSYGF
jgi:hypothetical protein